jgi:hypothetical protein
MGIVDARLVTAHPHSSFTVHVYVLREANVADV